jgi:single-strand DNA-binding protein
MPYLNSVVLSGRLTRDPELRYTQSGKALCNFAIAVTSRYKAASGEAKEEVYFADCKVWRPELAEYIGTKLAKGAPVIVTGELRQDEWTDAATNMRKTKLYVRVDRLERLAWSEGEAPSNVVPIRRGVAQESKVLAPDEDIPF